MHIILPYLIQFLDYMEIWVQCLVIVAPHHLSITVRAKLVDHKLEIMIYNKEINVNRYCVDNCVTAPHMYMFYVCLQCFCCR